MTASRAAIYRPLSADREMRFLPEVRAVSEEGKPLQIAGHAATFNTLAKLPGFRERILPGAFKRAIDQQDDVVCLWNHDSNKLLGRTTAGTLRLAQDSRGLRYVCDLPNTAEARGFHESIRRGDVTGSSFAFQVEPGDQDWDEAQDEEDRSYFVRRSIKSVTKLFDVSPVVRPAYNGAEVTARSNAVIPAELRSAVDAKNARHNYVKPRGLIFLPSVEECVQTTLRAEDRHRKATTDIVTRRKNLLNSLLQ
jgi:HK97 family phage prohead protease